MNNLFMKKDRKGPVLFSEYTPGSALLKAADMSRDDILFEIKDYDSVYFAIDNYQKFIKNETVSVQLDRMLKANIAAYKTFVKAYSENNSDEYNSAVKKLRNEIPSQFGDWILEKISEMT